VVDDERDILDSLTSLLEAAVDGVRVRVASSGQEALEILEREPVDLILTDYRMPGMNGLELLQAARRTHPGVPRILMTAFPELDIAITAINDAGIEFFLTKPLAPGYVIDIVRSILSAHHDATGRAVRDLARPPKQHGRAAPAPGAPR
jgi:two-component system response regulator YesN